MPVPNTDALLRIAYTAAENGDFDHVRRCYEQGAALGDIMCLHALGYMYDVGEGVPENKTLAMKIYRKAWRLGSHASACNIAGLYREQGRISMMFRWYQRVAAAGDGSAHLEMAKCYLTGSGVRKNPEAALRCLAVAIGSHYISEYEREEAKALLVELSPRLV
jgi:TPR repeat protein